MSMTRRECLGVLASGVVGAASGGRAVDAASLQNAAAGSKPMAGAFMILHTPFTESKAVDWDDLTREVEFVDRAGAQGIVWPQGSSGVATLTRDERLRGMEVIVKAAQGRKTAVVLGVQGKNIDEMLDYTRRAEALAPDAMIAMPPTEATSQEDYRKYFRALAGVTRRPVIVQTSGGARDLTPTTDLILDLARELPNFGYVKEESDPVMERMQAHLRHRPTMKGIFGASFATGWLYEMRLGLDGVITGNGMYADVMARMWALHKQGKSEALRDLFSKWLLMRNLNDAVPGTDLYVMKMRGIFKTTVTRARTFTFSKEAIAEIEYRFAGLAPYLTSS
jgi:4-hydroxy-tetrahydrodipicolinate synthase